MDHLERTRKIYEDQHSRISKDDSARERIFGLYKENNFGIDSDWFKGKTALDAGCGNIGSLIRRLVQLGTTKVHGIDIGSDWIPILQAQLRERGLQDDQYELRSGSVLDIPYENDSFDFVAINGVLIHLESIADVLRGFREGARVCKPGGYYFTSYGPCGGLIQGAIFPAVRRYYRQDSTFRSVIDALTPEAIHEVIDKVCSDAKKFGGQDLDADAIKSLFGEDFCVFLQNYIQAPSWLSNECTPELVEELYRAHGFKNVSRLNRYVVRTDIRKYFAPLHYDVDHPASQVLYGKGYVQYVGQKG